MKSIKTLICTLCATLAVLTFTQCHNTPQPVTHIVYDSVPAIKIAYVDIDTLLTSYNLWIELNEEMIRKDENARATINEKARKWQEDYEEFERKMNNNAFVSVERAETERARLIKQREDLELLQERLTNELMVENNKNSVLFRDSINAYIRDYNKVHKYNIILSRIGDNILYVDYAMNITQDIIDGLNARHAKYGKKK